MKRTAEKYGGSLFLEDKGDLFETKLMLTGIAELLGCYIPADFFRYTKIAFRYIGLNFKGKVAI